MTDFLIPRQPGIKRKRKPELVMNLRVRPPPFIPYSASSTQFDDRRTSPPVRIVGYTIFDPHEPHTDGVTASHRSPEVLARVELAADTDA